MRFEATCTNFQILGGGGLLAEFETDNFDCQLEVGKRYMLVVMPIDPPAPRTWCLKCGHPKHGTAVCGVNTGPATDPAESQCDCAADNDP